MPTGSIIKIGDEFTRLTVLAPAGRDRDGKSLWLCACACFNLTWARTAQLNSRLKKSCGCLVRENAVKRNTIHGMTQRQHYAPEHSSWSQMKSRCDRPNPKSWHRYGGRGIAVCAGLRDFMFFYRLVGRRPTSQHSIDRTENNGNYSCGACAECVERGWPMNVRWATKKEQSANTSATVLITHNDETHCIAEWARLKGMSDATLRGRLKRMSVERALTMPVQKKNRTLTRDDETHKIREWSNLLHIPVPTIRDRLRKEGRPIEEVLSTTPLPNHPKPII